MLFTVTLIVLISFIDIISQLKEKGEILDFPTESQIDSMLKLGLLCNQCSFEAKTMPQLKTHLESHLLT